jgi:hypothetical protein
VYELAAFSIAAYYSAATSNNNQQDEQYQDKTDVVVVVEGAAYISRHYTMHLLVIKYSVMYVGCF